MLVADPSTDGEVTAAVMTLWPGSQPPFHPPRWEGWKANKYSSLPRSVCTWNRQIRFTQARLGAKSEAQSFLCFIYKIGTQ